MSPHLKLEAPLRNPRRRAGGEPSKKQQRIKGAKEKERNVKLCHYITWVKEGSSPCIITAWLALLDGVGSHFVVCII